MLVYLHVLLLNYHQFAGINITQFFLYILSL